MKQASKAGHGGARRGAGRPPLPDSAVSAATRANRRSIARRKLRQIRRQNK